MVSDDAIFNATDIFPSGKSTFRKNVDTLFARITRLPFAASLTNEELYLVLDEALSNAMEHGNGWDDRKEVTVTTVLNDEVLTITVQDQGSGYLETPAYDTSQPLRSRRGRGLFLLSRLCGLARNAAGNELKIMIRRQGRCF